MANGTLRLFLNPKSRWPFFRNQYFVVTGGPYRDREQGYTGVKLAVEINLPCEIDIPAEDFSVPDKKLVYQGLPKVVKAILAGQPVYMGCMGGIGRTGLMLALLAKAFGVKNPVKYVRAEYLSYAVEKPVQHQFIKEFQIPPSVYILIKEARTAQVRNVWKVWQWGQKNLTQFPQGSTPQDVQNVLDEVR